jgi:hypothetical protein
MPADVPTNVPDKDNSPPPLRAPGPPYRPMGPQGLPWRGWVRWLFRGLTSVGRGVELAAAGALVAGAAVTLYAGAPPLLAALRSAPSCVHQCSHQPVPATDQEPGAAAPVAGRGDKDALRGSIEKESKDRAIGKSSGDGKGGIATAS